MLCVVRFVSCCLLLFGSLRVVCCLLLGVCLVVRCVSCCVGSVRLVVGWWSSLQCVVGCCWCSLFVVGCWLFAVYWLLMLCVACCCGACVVYRVLFVVVCLFDARCSSLAGVCCLLYVVRFRGLLFYMPCCVLLLLCAVCGL